MDEAKSVSIDEFLSNLRNSLTSLAQVDAELSLIISQHILDAGHPEGCVEMAMTAITELAKTRAAAPQDTSHA